MAVTQNGSAVNSGIVDSDTNSISVTVASGDALFVCVGWYSSSSTISSVVWDPPTANQALTQVGSAIDGYSEFRTSIYRIASPTAKTANLVITFSGGAISAASVTRWTGVDTTTPTHDAVTGSGETATSTATVANVVAGEVCIDCHVMVRGDEDQPGAGQTALMAQNIFGSADQWVVGSSKDTSSTGSVVMSWAQTESTRWAVVACAIKAAAAGGTAKPKIMNSMLRRRRQA